MSADDSVQRRSANQSPFIRTGRAMAFSIVLGALGGAALYQQHGWPVFALTLGVAFVVVGRSRAGAVEFGPTGVEHHANTWLMVALYWVALFTVSFDVLGEAFATNFAPGLFWRIVVALAAGIVTASGYVVATIVAVSISRSSVARGSILGATVLAWEWARTELLHWPPGLIAYALTDSPWLLTAPYLGAYGAGAAFVGVVAASSLALTSTCPRRRLNAAVLVVLIAGTMLLLPATPTDTSDRPAQAISTSVVLLRTTPEQKYNRGALRDRTEEVLRRAELSNSDLIVFPETALPLPWHQLPASVLARFRALGQHKTLIIGSFRESQGRSYNTAVAMAPGRAIEFVDKRLLFIFSEYFPNWLQWAKPLMQMPYQDLSQGTIDQRVGSLPGVLICQDIGSPQLVAQRARDRQWLVLLSDMSWFPGARAAAHQLLMARWRAAETRRWLLVAGVPSGSALIAPDGQVAERAPPGTDTWDVKVPQSH